MTVLVSAAHLARQFVTALPLAVPLALVAGAHAATWGAYKDAPYEGYHPVRQIRTLAVAMVAAVVGVMSGLVDAHAFVPALGVVYALERLATEWWKTILRVDDQSAYTIPMRLGFHGRPVDIDGVRYGVGGLVLVVMAGLTIGVHAAQGTAEHLFGGVPWWLVVAAVGGLGGWLTAVGGAWKDAPVEGFSFWKFLRSPVVATSWAVPLSLMTDSWVTLCLAAGGLSVFSIETYKTFWTGGRAPGKFAEQPVRDALPALRRAMGVLHAGAWALFALAGLREALSGLAPEVSLAAMGRLRVAVSTEWMHVFADPLGFAGVVSSAAVAAAAFLAAGLVLRANWQLTSSPLVPVGQPGAEFSTGPTARTSTSRDDRVA